MTASAVDGWNAYWRLEPRENKEDWVVLSPFDKTKVVERNKKAAEFIELFQKHIWLYSPFRSSHSAHDVNNKTETS